MSDGLKLPGKKPVAGPLAAPFAFIRNPFRRQRQPSPDGRREPDADLLAEGWRLVGVDKNGQKIYAPPSRYSQWRSW